MSAPSVADLEPNWVEVDLHPDTVRDIERLTALLGLRFSDVVNRAVSMYRLLEDDRARGREVATFVPGSSKLTLIREGGGS